MALAETAKLVASLELQDKFSKPAAAAERSLGRLEGKTTTLGKVGTRAGQGLSRTGDNLRKLGTIAGVTVIGGFVAATKAAINFEDAFSGIRKTVDETDLKAAGLSFEDLSNQIRGMAREIPVAADDLARIGEAAGALGISGKDITGFTEVVAKLGVTTDLSTDQAATALGQLGTTLHLSGGEFQEFADSLVALGNAGASTESQIIEIANRFAAAGNAAGLSKEEVLAMSSAVASMGINAEAGGSSLSRIFNSVTTNIGTSSAKAEVFADTIGLPFQKFREAWRTDALGTFQDFLGKLGELDKFKQANILQKIGITGTRDVNALQLMVDNMGFFNDQLDISRHATGALNTEAQKKFATTASQIQLMKNNLTDVGITIGSAVLPKITELSKELVGAVNSPEVQRGIKQFAASLPGTIDELVRIARGLPWGAIGSSLQIAGTGAKAVMTAFTSLPGWVQTAVLTGWGLNKLTGGALGGIVGELGKGLIKGVLGMNAGVVNINAATVNGGAPIGGAPPAGGKLGGGLLGGVAKFVLGPAAAVVIGAEIAKAINEQTIGPAREFEQKQVKATLEHADAAQIQSAIDSIDDQLNSSDLGTQTALIASRIPIIGDALSNVAPTLEKQREQLKARLDAVKAEEAKTGQIYAHGASEHNRVIRQEWRQAAQKIDGGILSLAQSERADAQRQLSETKRITPSLARVENIDRGVLEQTRATANRTSQAIERIRAVEAASRGTTATLERKNFSPNVDLTVGVTNQISISTISGAIQRDTYSTATGRVGGVIV